MGREEDNGRGGAELEAPRSRENTETAANKPTGMVKDWSTDYFPTSAKPIFIGWALLALGVILLCGWVYYISPHPLDPEKAKKQEAIKERMNVEEDDE